MLSDRGATKPGPVFSATLWAAVFLPVRDGDAPHSRLADEAKLLAAIAYGIRGRHTRSIAKKSQSGAPTRSRDVPLPHDGRWMDHGWMRDLDAFDPSELLKFLPTPPPSNPNVARNGCGTRQVVWGLENRRCMARQALMLLPFPRILDK